MQVRTTVETTQEVVVDISLDDVMTEIASLDEPERVQEALRLLSLCLGAVMKVPDSILVEMTSAQKKVVTDALRAQIDRYEAA